MKYLLSIYSFMLLTCCLSQAGCAQTLQPSPVYNHNDTLRGSITPERAWWDVMRYDLWVSPDYANKTIRGKTVITFTVLETEHPSMQIDLQAPMRIDSFFIDNKKSNEPILSSSGSRDHYFIKTPAFAKGEEHSLTLYYHGQPKEAVNPPWDGGWIWKKDNQGRPWMSVACQGLGASVWYPCKDHQSDEPDKGASLSVTVPDTLVAVGNGRLQEEKAEPGKMTTWKWEVQSPINTYNIVPYIGNYTHFSDVYTGETGKPLTLDYWVLDYNEAKAKKQFQQVKPMLQCFEYWFGPYPFYEDGYKLVESPHLGMEHQSAVAYGNHYSNGYLGRDLSASGWGLKWDYIIIHESGHEWFANSITTKDIADMWVHEGFTDYAETLYTECQFGKKAANEYNYGLRLNIDNDIPIIGPYGVNKEGSGDMYYKGANMLHTIRQVIDNDSLFRQMLRGLNKTFYHRTVTGKQVEEYMIRKTGKNLSPIFDQYLRTIKIPELQVKKTQKGFSYRWANTVPHFDMPVKIVNGHYWLHPTTKWQTITGKKELPVADGNFYITVRNVN